MMEHQKVIDTEEKKNVEELLTKYPGIFDIRSDRNKVLCRLTKHELPLSIKALDSYIKGKRFQLLLKKVKKPEVVLRIDDKYKDYFIPSKKSASRLFCTLTRKEINKLPHEIEKYITGYKFLKAVDLDKERKANGIEPEKVVEKEEEEVNEDEQDDNEEEEDIPFFVLSEGEEEDENGDITEGDEDSDEIIDEDEAEEKCENDVDMKDEKEENEPVDTDNKENDIHGKKRKNKPAKEKIKTKKVKHGAK